MTHRYQIPEVTVGRPKAVIWLCLSGALLTVLLIRHLWFLLSWDRYQVLTGLWMFYFLISGVQWALSWLERPFTVTREQQLRLDRLTVTVSVPVFNEDPEVLDRVLFALFQQTRLPQRVQVVDDGSRVDYGEVRGWWLTHRPDAVDFSWARQENAGKKAAQARTFLGDPADVFVTLDSDTVLERRALDEGLKPFAQERVQSVAGLELAWNHDRNMLTRVNSTRQMVWQLVTCSAQSVARGSVLINRGTYALYRGQLVREVLPAYVGETFWGRPILLGDDTFLTTQALCRGRAVQQPSAVCLTMYPENLSHHLRQWTRWMRGTTLRTFWRLRYLRVASWGWFYTLFSTWWFLASLTVMAVLAAFWPRSAGYTQTMLAAGLAWAWIMSSRLLVVQRSDQRLSGRLAAAAIAPASALWVSTTLRLVRVYGTFTFLRQGWTTRSRVEVFVDPEAAALIAAGGAAVGGLAGARPARRGWSPTLLAIGVVLAILAAFQFTLLRSLGQLRLDSPLGLLPLLPVFALWLALDAVRRQRGNPAPIRDRQLDCILGVPLLLVALFLICVTPVMWGAFYWSVRPDVLALAVFASGLVVVAYGVGWAWRLRSALLLLLLAWPALYLPPLVSALQHLGSSLAGGAASLAAALPLGVLPLAGHPQELLLPSGRAGLLRVPVGQLLFSAPDLVCFLLVGLAVLAGVKGGLLSRIRWICTGLLLTLVLATLAFLAALGVAEAGRTDLVLGPLAPALGVLALVAPLGLMLGLTRRFGLGVRPPAGELRRSRGLAGGGIGPTVVVPTRSRLFGLSALALVGLACFALSDQGLSAYTPFATPAGQPTLGAMALSARLPRGWRLHLLQDYANAPAYFGEGSVFRRYRVERPEAHPSPLEAEVVIAPAGTDLAARLTSESFVFGIYRVLQARSLLLGPGVTGTVLDYLATGHDRRSAAVAWSWPVEWRGQPAAELVVLSADLGQGPPRVPHRQPAMDPVQVAVLSLENLVGRGRAPSSFRATELGLTALGQRLVSGWGRDEGVAR